MPCGSRSDHRVVITAPEAATSYWLTFGSLLRAGVIHETDPDLSAVLDTSGRVIGGEVSVAADRSHTYTADGPIRLRVVGDASVSVRVNGDEYALDPGETLSTSCPTERRRKAVLGAVAGGLATTVLPTG